MTFSFFEFHVGHDAFKKAKPATVGCEELSEEIDAGGNDVIIVGNCADALIGNAKKTIRIDKKKLSTYGLIPAEAQGCLRLIFKQTVLNFLY